MEKLITLSPAIVSFFFYLLARKHSIRNVAFLIFVLSVFALAFYEYKQPGGHPHADFGILNLSFELAFIGGPNIIVFIMLMAPFLFVKKNNNEE